MWCGARRRGRPTHPPSPSLTIRDVTMMAPAHPPSRDDDDALTLTLIDESATT